jgi:DNA invertase Pin-like site-specific DNA recombinase
MQLAYSYIRFSSKKQELGASLKRQLEMAQAYAAEHQMQLDDHSYRDLGVSARKGKNKTDGKLGMFLAALEKGTIKSGAYLLIEALDRLSREDVDDALRQFLNILHYGITVVTLSDKQEYSTARTKTDHGMSLVQSIMYMGRANEENERKSQRVADAKVRARQAMDQGIIATAMAPAWLKPGQTRKTNDWIIDQSKVKTVHLIFELAIAGNGAPAIARTLNQRNVPTMQRAKLWSFGTVAAILKNEAVTGTFRRRKSLRQ